MNATSAKSHDFRGLPPLLGELARHMGSADGARSLAGKFGGRRISVPREAGPNQVIAKACGIDVARALTELRGGECIYIPLNLLGSKKIRIEDTIMKARHDGRELSANQVAEIVGCSEKYVRQIRAGLDWAAEKATA